MKETKLFELVTGTEMNPWLSRNMLPNINTCENGWSDFSANLRVVSIKLFDLTRFAWPNLSICFNFLCAVPRDDVIESTRFLMRPPVIIPPWLCHTMVTFNQCINILFNIRISSILATPVSNARNFSWCLFTFVRSTCYISPKTEYQRQWP